MVKLLNGLELSNMLTEKEKEQIRRVFDMKNSQDKEVRMLATQIKKQYNLNNLFIRLYTGGYYLETAKKVSEIKSAEAIIKILDNIDKPYGKITYKGGNTLVFPVLVKYDSSKNMYEKPDFGE